MLPLSRKIRWIVAAVGLLSLLAAVLLYIAWRRPTGRLLDGSIIALENVTYGKEHVSSTEPPVPLRYLPKKWLSALNWKPGTKKTSKHTNDFFVFWLTMDDVSVDRSLRYTLADENGFETPMLFSMGYFDYKTSGFGTNHAGVMRSPGLYPRRSRRFDLRLYQQNPSGEFVRVANFPIHNTPPKNIPEWTASALPAKYETNGCAFILETARVGVQPKEKLIPPYDFHPGNWSEFNFRVSENGKPAESWNINEIWIYDATGNYVRTSNQDRWTLNGGFARVENDKITCTDRWMFWTGEPAWKLRVLFRHPEKGDVWAEYFVKPDFTTSAP